MRFSLLVLAKIRPCKPDQSSASSSSNPPSLTHNPATIRVPAEPAKVLEHPLGNLNIAPDRIQRPAKIRKAPNRVHLRHTQVSQSLHKQKCTGETLCSAVFCLELRIHPHHEMLSADIKRSPNLNDTSHSINLTPAMAFVMPNPKNEFWIGANLLFVIVWQLSFSSRWQRRRTEDFAKLSLLREEMQPPPIRQGALNGVFLFSIPPCQQKSYKTFI